MGETYYDVLGVDPDASVAVIERAYRERVLETHPDHNDAPDAAERFSRVTTAADVLTDELERARYDRLGHDGYVASGSDASRSAANDDSGDEPVGTDRGWPDEGWWERYASRDRASTADPSGPSHHARHRARRDRARRERWRTDTGGSGSVGDSGSSFGNGTRQGSRSGFARSTGSGGRRESSYRQRAGRDPWAHGSTAGTGSGRSGYVVTQWDDEVELKRPFRPLDGSTIVVGAGIAAIYPVLVYGTITPVFPWPVNLCIGACTLLVIGYLLTTPRVALCVFGSLSLLASAWFAIGRPVSPLSPLALGVLGGFWIPFGYALAVWWVLTH
ncbi:J domain-containing protein [Halovivax cerinus]|uniref:J domain-containing protein n=1 Tax=Halovivax cerinus TaxID=1487865 RepID=A0ABD5NSH1_9EURY|nr:DnaJ domain-containing protein [Halovivax cerinus]